MPKASRNTTAAGYGNLHQREKRRLNPIVEKQGAICMQPDCLMPTRLIPPGTRPHEWHLGHTPDRTAWIGPTHPKCNTTDGARRRHVKQRIPVIIRRWAL